MKSVHRDSLLNSRIYNTIMLYKGALQNDEYASCLRLDTGGLLIHRSCILFMVSNVCRFVDEYASCLRLDTGGLLIHGSCILVVISATKTGGRLICGSTYMQVDTVTKLPAAKTSMYNLFSYNNINIKILDLISYEIH